MKNHEFIESPKNPKFKTWSNLKSAKGIKKAGKTLITGKNVVSEYFTAFYDQQIEVLYTESMGIPVNLGPKAKAYKLSEPLFKEIDPLGLHFPILVVDIPEISDWNLKSDSSLQVLLPLGDPKNLGAAIRNCLAFGVDSVILLKEAAHPYHHSTIKASSGAVFKIKILNGPSIQDLKLQDSPVFCLDGGGLDLRDFNWPQKTLLLVGEEGLGVPDFLKHRDTTLSIPISGKIESLNAHQALGIALYDRTLKIKK